MDIKLLFYILFQIQISLTIKSHENLFLVYSCILQYNKGQEYKRKYPRIKYIKTKFSKLYSMR